MAITSSIDLGALLEKKTVNGYTCRETILNHCRLASPHVWTDVINRWKDSPFGATSNEGAHFSLISTFGRNNSIMHRPLFDLKINALLLNKQISQYMPENLLIQRGPSEVLGLALRCGIFRSGEMSFIGDEGVSTQESSGINMSDTATPGGPCSSTAGLGKSPAASEYASSVQRESGILSRLCPLTSKKREPKTNISQESRRNIFKKAKRPPGKY